MAAAPFLPRSVPLGALAHIYGAPRHISIRHAETTIRRVQGYCRQTIVTDGGCLCPFTLSNCLSRIARCAIPTSMRVQRENYRLLPNSHDA